MNREELKQKMKDADDKWKRLNIPIHMDVKIEDFLEVFEEYEKKEIAALKAKLEDAKASAYADSVDAGMRERRLRRALWLARAERAEARKNYWHVRCCHEGDKDLRSIDGSAVKYIGCIKRTNFDWLKVWSEVEIKCREKAEQYK